MGGDEKVDKVAKQVEDVASERQVEEVVDIEAEEPGP